MNLYKTSDLAIAAYLMLHDFKLKDASRTASGRFLFVFEDPNDAAKSKAVEFLSSDCCKFDTHVKNLKKIIF
jgi:hypothetical protein